MLRNDKAERKGRGRLAVPMNRHGWRDERTVPTRRRATRRDESDHFNLVASESSIPNHLNETNREPDSFVLANLARETRAPHL
jgi:hypothetical protein